MYIKTNWVAGETEVSAENLNKIEEGIYKNSLEVSSFTEEVEGSFLTIDGTKEGYLENVEILGNTIQDIEQTGNLADIRSIGDKVEGQELYEIPVVSYGKNLFNGSIFSKLDTSFDFNVPVHICEGEYRISFTSNVSYSQNSIYLKSINPSYNRFIGMVTNYNGRVSGNLTINTDDMNIIKSSTNGLRFSIYRGDGISDIPTDILITQSDDLSYEPYQEDKLTILSPVQLEKVGDVADRIICKDGVFGVEKNIKTTKLKRTTTWTWYTDNLFKYCSTDIHITDSSSGNVMSDIGANIWINNVGTVRDYSTVDNIEYLNNLDSFIVKYPTTQPTFIPLPHDQQIKLRTFADRTNISFLTEIEPTIKASVPKSLGATVNTHTTQMDNLNKELDRVKKLEESTVSTVTSDKGFTTIVETSGGYFEDVRLEGRTLVNLAQSSNLYYKRGINGIGAGVDLTSTIESGLDDRPNRCCYKINVKPNTSYTFITCGNTIYDNYSIVQTSNNIVVSPVAMWKKFDLFTPSPTVDTIYVHLKVDSNDSDFTSVDQLKDHLIILEGDHTDKDISYFEGLKSVGQGTDEISVSSVNGGVDNANNKFIEIHLDTGREESILYCLCTGFNHISTDENVFLYRNGEKLSNGVTRRYYTKDKKYIGATITSDSFYVRYRFSSGSSTYEGNISEYEVKNSIECIEQDKKPILYFNPTTQTWEKPVLREWDSIEKHSDGKYYYHKRSEEVVLNGSESWTTYIDLGSTGRSYIEKKSFNVGGKIYSNCISDILENCTNLGADGNNGIWCNHTNNRIGINLDKSKLSTNDIEGFKSWLQDNNVTVVYELAQEEVYECTNLDLITYQNETNLIVNSGAIQPKLTLKVLSNVSNVVKLLQEKVSVLEDSLSSYMINQNAMMLNTRYISDTTEFTVNTFANVVRLCEPNSDEKLYKLIRDNIVVGKDNYERNWMEEVVTFYWLEFKLSDEMYNELMLLIEMQHSTSIIEGEEIE